MNDSEKISNVYGALVDLSARVSVLKCLDNEMFSFPDCSSNGSHKLVISGVTLIASDLYNQIQEICKLLEE